MTSATTESFDPEIDRQAAEWFGRREGGLSVAQEREFERWLAADPRHAAHYGQFDETWQLLAELKERIRPAAIVASGSGRATCRRLWLPAVLAAAAACVVVAVIDRPMRPPAAVRTVIATEAGGLRKLALPDGSVVRLNADTLIAVEVEATERRVRLERGEAHFTVAKDPARPFIVRAGGVAVRAVGTEFNVALRSAQLEVLVTEGRVAVETIHGHTVLPARTAAQPLLEAGHKAVVTLGAAAVPRSAATVSVVPTAEAERALAWQAKQLDFDDQPLAAIVAEFNRYNQHQLVIADDTLARRSFGGTFRADDSEAFVELLGSRFGVVVERSGDVTTLRLHRRK